MQESIFVICWAAALAPLFVWGFRNLPGERWQFIAAVPCRKIADGKWAGINLTYYGALLSAGTVAGAALLLVLLGSLGQPRFMILGILLILLMICVPSAQVVAMLVERKRYTLTVGGACFVGMIIAPPVVYAMGRLVAVPMGFRLDVMPTITALMIAYTMGEGIGRLACLSFGCCYGRPVDDCPSWVRSSIGRWAVVFEGRTKKACYASGFEGRPLVAVQAFTSLVYLLLALVSMRLFLSGWFASSLFMAVLSQVWRFLSEFVRADYRGGGRISAYQVMALATFGYLAAAAGLFRNALAAEPDIRLGLAAVWDPGTILLLILLWLSIFLRTGVSSVTGSRLSFHVVSERV